MSLHEQFRFLYVIDNSLLSLSIRWFVCKSNAMKEINFKGYFPPGVSSGIKKKKSQSTKGNCSIFCLGAVLPYSMSQSTVRVITWALSSPARPRHHFNNRLVDFSNTTFQRADALPSITCFSLLCLLLTRQKAQPCCSEVKEHSHTTDDMLEAC